MSDTPRTDAARRQHQATLWQGRDATTIETVDIEFARELERENAELKEREALDRATAPLIELLMTVDMPTKIIYNTKTGEMKKEYSAETKELMDKINGSIAMFREHFFPSNSNIMHE